MVKLDLLNMAFGLVHSSVERSTSRHGHLQASARLLYRLALVLVLGLIVWKWVNLEHSVDSNQECGIGFGNLPGSLSRHVIRPRRQIGQIKKVTRFSSTAALVSKPPHQQFLSVQKIAVLEKNESIVSGTS